MTAPYSDHFAPVAAGYAAFRPRYPAALFEWLATNVPPSATVWDCGAGSGQATGALANRFRRVIASDPSAAQVSHRVRTENVAWLVSSAEHSPLAEASIDLVTVAQALHWFDLDRFWPEVRRVLVPAGWMVAWTYGHCAVDDTEISHLLRAFAHDTVGAWWPPDRAHVDDGYSRIDFPFIRAASPEFAMTESWSVDQLLGYLRSWSATTRYHQATGHDPVNALDSMIRSRWGEDRRTVRWPLTVLAGRRAGIT